jgi:transcriptional regulator with XRE-family HTH domain
LSKTKKAEQLASFKEKKYVSNIARRRVEMDLTQEELAIRSGLDVFLIRRLEGQYVKVSGVALVNLMRVLDLPWKKIMMNNGYPKADADNGEIYLCENRNIRGSSLKPDFKVTRLRKKHGMTCKSLASRIGCSGYTICKMENGKKPVSKMLMKALSHCFGVTVHSLFDERGFPKHADKIQALETA